MHVCGDGVDLLVLVGVDADGPGGRPRRAASNTPMPGLAGGGVDDVGAVSYMPSAMVLPLAGSSKPVKSPSVGDVLDVDLDVRVGLSWPPAT